MTGVVQDPRCHLHVLHCESLLVHQAPPVDLAMLAKCQCHWYIGDAHHASEVVGIFHPGQSLRLDFCTFVVADVDRDFDVKLTVATVAGDHLAVFFGRLSELTQSEQFTRHELELRNVEGVVASAVVFCAEQQRWTVQGKGVFRPPGEAVTVGPEDMQASYVLQHIFPDESVKDPKPDPIGDTGVVASERCAIDGKDSSEATQEPDEAIRSRRPSREKVRRRSVLREGRKSQKSKAAELLKEGFGLGQSDASTANSGTDAVEVHSKAQSEATEDEKSKEVVQDGEEKLRQPSADILPGPVELSDGPLEVPPPSGELPWAPANNDPEDANREQVAQEASTLAEPDRPFIEEAAPEVISAADKGVAEDKEPSDDKAVDLTADKDEGADVAGPSLPASRPSTPESHPPVASEREPSPSPVPADEAQVSKEAAHRARHAALLRMDSESEVSMPDSDADLPLPSSHELAQALGRVPATSSRPWQKAHPWRGRGPVVAAKGLWCRAQRAYAEDCLSHSRPGSLTDEDSPRTFAGTHWLTGGRWEELLKRDHPPKNLTQPKESKDTIPAGGGSEGPGALPDDTNKVPSSGGPSTPVPLGGWRVQQQGRWFRVSATALSIRRRPQVDAPLAGELPFGEVFQAVSSFTAEDGFTFLELSRGRGWVFSDARVQPVLVIDDTGDQPVASPGERRLARPAEAEAEPEPGCRFSPRISSVESPDKALEAQASPAMATPKSQRGKVVATRAARARASSATANRRRITARPTTLAAGHAPAQAALRTPAAPVHVSEPTPQTSPEPTEAPKPGNARDRYPSPNAHPLALEASSTEKPTKEAWPKRGREPVRAKHSLASQCAVGPSASHTSLVAPELDRGLDADRYIEPRRSSSVRSARESLEERQRMQAALLRVALRVNADDGDFGSCTRSCSVPWRSRIATSVFPAKRPGAEEAPAMVGQAGQRRRGATGAGAVSLSCQFLAAIRGETTPLTPRRAQPQVEEAMRAQLQRRCSSVPSRHSEAPNHTDGSTVGLPYGFADILLAASAS
ncbi:unnamed protein product [Symbiodinium natans]|uniref:Uncharacterized protein n=1 Tax=Symbiodinium natans TaxID=878477 RepID=A0A812P6M4_9DINO|nr:unnamed protein product [Symbiodinium natans]